MSLKIFFKKIFFFAVSPSKSLISAIIDCVSLSVCAHSPCYRNYL